MTDSVTTIPQDFVKVQDTAPGSPFEGQLWRDTSSNTLKQWDGSSWVSVQTSPDGVTLQINENGELEVVPVITMIGDFENNAKGDWTGDYSIESDQGGAESSSYYLHENPGTDITLSVSRSFNLSGASEITFYMRISPIGFSNNGTSNDKQQFRISGNVEAEIVGGSSTGWQKYIVDVGNYDGTHTLEFFYDNNSGQQFGVGADRIKVSRIATPTPEDGSGGTT